MPLNANARFWIGLLATAASSVALNAIILSFTLGTYRTELSTAVEEIQAQKTYVRDLVTQQAVAQSERSAASSAIVTMSARIVKHDDTLAELAEIRSDVAWLKTFLTTRAKNSDQ